MTSRVLVIACGALARELLATKALNGMNWLDVACLPAILHNRPERIAPAVRARIQRARKDGFTQILCLYGDCGTGGELDRMLAEEAVERIEGAHCYAFYAGLEAFDDLMHQEVGTYFLTDYLARHFDRIVWKGLGLDHHPELFDDYFRHYRRVVHLVQFADEAISRKAQAAAGRLRLPLETRLTGPGLLPSFLGRATPPV